MGLCAMRIRNLWGQCKGLILPLEPKLGKLRKYLLLGTAACLWVCFFSLAAMSPSRVWMGVWNQKCLHFPQARKRKKRDEEKWTFTEGELSKHIRSESDIVGFLLEHIKASFCIQCNLFTSSWPLVTCLTSISQLILESTDRSAPGYVHVFTNSLQSAYVCCSIMRSFCISPGEVLAKGIWAVNKLFELFRKEVWWI